MLSFLYGSEEAPEPRNASLKAPEPTEACVETAATREPGKFPAVGLMRLFSPRKNGRTSRTASPSPVTSSAPLAPVHMDEPSEAATQPVDQLAGEASEAEAVTIAADVAVNSDASPADVVVTTDAPPASEVSSNVDNVTVSLEVREAAEETALPCETTSEHDMARAIRGTAVHVVSLLALPASLPFLILYKTGSVALTILSRVLATFHSVLFEEDPGKFERILMRNVHFMDGSMRQMNASLTTAINTVEKQMEDITRLENLWQREHQAYLTALHDRKATESEFKKTERIFREEMSAAKQAAVGA